MNQKRRQHLQYVIAGLFSIVLVGLLIRYPEYSGIEGTAGYALVIVIVGYAFALSSNRVRHSRWFPFLQAGFFLAWGSYNALRGRWGLLTLVLLGGGILLICWEGYKLVRRPEPPVT